MHTTNEESSVSAQTDLYPGTEFLLAEFESSRDFIKQYRERIDKRVEVLIIILATAAGGIVFLSQLHVNPTLAFIAAAFVSLPIAMQALYIAVDVLKTDLAISHHREAIRRVRQYFAEEYPGIAPSLFLARSRADMGQVEISSDWRIPEAICAIAAGGLVGSLWSGVANLLLGHNDTTADVIGYLLGFVLAAVCALVLDTRFSRKYKELEEALTSEPSLAKNPARVNTR
jgi:hypothetical protein